MTDFLLQLSCFAQVTIIIVIIIIGTVIYFSERLQTFVVNRKIRRYFGFLFEHGFEVDRVYYSSKSFGNWFVELRSGQRLVFIENDRGYVQVVIYPYYEFRKISFELERLIDHITNVNSAKKPQREKTSVDNQLKFFGNTFRIHYDQIIVFFEDMHFQEEERKYRAKYSIHQ